MGKILALDLGEVWTGIAISDPLKTLARPIKATKTTDLFATLRELLKQEKIDTIVVGHPITLAGRDSKQTERAKEQKTLLEKEFPSLPFLLWDERLSSKQASHVQFETQKKRSPDTKLQSHSIAAAVILDTYLLFYQHSQACDNED